MLSLIAAMDRNALIGTAGYLPWHLPADLMRFQKLTLYHPLIMGRKTWESIGGKALPRQENIVLTRGVPACTLHWSARRATHMEHALALAAMSARQHNLDEVFVIGGADVFAQALPLADRLYLTLIDHEFSADVAPTYFPGGIPGGSEWRTIQEEVGGTQPWPYRFVVLDRVPAAVAGA